MIKKLFSFASFSLLISGFIVLTSTSLVSAAPPKKPGSTTAPIGIDVSWPQCGRTLPTYQAFGIVGVNGGLASTTNECMVDQLRWAAKSSGVIASQPAVQLYLNTGNPGEVLAEYKVTTWPTNNNDPLGNTSTNPLTCTPQSGAYNDYRNDTACSWQYGWNRAVEAVQQRFPAAATSAGLSSLPATYTWWLDVETSNSWQTAGTAAAFERNRATLEGMTAYLKSLNVKVGLYSTGYQWGVITGSVPASSNLTGLDSWLAGARSYSDAQTKCKLSPLTPGGKVTLVQYINNRLDHNYACM